MPDSILNNVPQPSSVNPDYIGLIRFLVEPFLESPASLKVDCEVIPARSRVWIRLAFEGEDKGRVFGRGGRNIQAIRTVLSLAAKAAGYSTYLDIYGGQPTGRDDVFEDRAPATKSQPRPLPKPRSQ